MNNIITEEKVKKYFSITEEAIRMVKMAGFDELREEEAKDFLNMAENYFSDAGHFYAKGDVVLAFAALNYAHGWLDAGARIALFKVSDSRLFTVDEDRFDAEEAVENELVEDEEEPVDDE